jgi:hypothetical protein
MRSNRVPTFTLVGWTLFVWVTRIRNIVGDDELTGSARAWRLGAAVAFVGFAVALLAVRRFSPARSRVVLAPFMVLSVGYWLVRGTGILVADHDVGFKVVHTVLMVISIVLAMWAWRRRDE